MMGERMLVGAQPYAVLASFLNDGAIPRRVQL